MFAQKITLTAGAAGGIGQALALLFTRDGSLLCVTFAGQPGFTKDWNLPA